YMPEPGDVQKIRQEIDYNWEEFAVILKNRSFVKVFGSLEKWEEITLAREPKGYDKNNPAIEWLKLKSWVATAPISDQEILQADLPKTILQAFAAIQPLLYFLNRAVGDE
ncbi:MAG: DUF2461 domain-containing protein, partial [Sediminibacterium sp.]|nr:DUF2461 domain-containing protein [Sediminibacterium sp.]